MKTIFSVLLLFVFLCPVYLHAQIQNVIVETYYISDTNDATDTTNGRTLDAGSKTYRVYVELTPGSKIRKIYGDVNHALKISSTADFFNNIDRPAAYFGYLVNKAWFIDNPTLALDSWLTLGRATRVHAGVLKQDDTDGSLIGGAYNNGGTAGVPGGLLVNTDPSAGIALTSSDGLFTDTAVLTQWSDYGFKDFSGTDTTIFGSVNVGSQFISQDVFLQQNSGSTGVLPGNNKVLVAQLTTTGNISFELNLEVEEPDGAFTKIVKYVADDDTLSSDERVSPYLTYPPVCGCRDPRYLEYSAGYACDNVDSCMTPVVFGCMDSLACNFDSNANFHLQTLCCYPGYCNDRDISIVCPSVNINYERYHAPDFNLYPNPAQDQVTIQFSVGDNTAAKYVIYNAYGRVVGEKNMGIVSGNIMYQVEVTDLDIGLYLIRLFTGDRSDAKMFMKN